MLDAAAAGGELLVRLNDEGALRDDDARWCTACVVAALASLHAQGTVYRVRPPAAALLATPLHCDVMYTGIVCQQPRPPGVPQKPRVPHHKGVLKAGNGCRYGSQPLSS